MNDWRWKWRFYASAFLLGLVLAGLSVRLVFLHALTPESVVRGIDESRRMHKQLLAGRGAICDRMGSGNLLALNVPMKDVCANPALIVRSNLLVDVSATLSELLDVPVDEVAQRLNARVPQLSGSASAISAPATSWPSRESCLYPESCRRTAQCITFFIFSGSICKIDYLYL